MKKHLWQVEHSYYCHETRYGDDENYETVDEFLSEYDDADFSMNLVVRWDWEVDASDATEQISVIFVMQRKGFLKRVTIEKPKGAADELKMRRFLEPRFEHLKKLWHPLG